MKTQIAFVLGIAAASILNAQMPAIEKATGNMWLDAFAGRAGAVIYPQYAWSVPTLAGNCGGYGFIESAPHERLFTNNLVNCTPGAAPWFTAHGEVGGLPGYAKGFVQLGPRINFQKVIPKLSKMAPSLFVAYLPAFVGIRTNNVLVAGSSRQFPIVGNGLTAHVEAFDRIFSNFSYSEVWVVGHVHSWKHVEPAAHMIRDTNRNPTYTLAFGFRISLK